MSNLILTGKEIREKQQDAEIYKCPRCGTNNWSVSINKEIQVWYIECHNCGMSAAIFKRGE